MANYFLHTSDVTFRMAENRMEVHQKRAKPWNVTLVAGNEASVTGVRLLRICGQLETKAHSA